MEPVLLLKRRVDMFNIYVEKSSYDYPCTVNSRYIALAYIKEEPCSKERYRVFIETTSERIVEYGRYITENDALIALEQLSNLMELGE